MCVHSSSSVFCLCASVWCSIRGLNGVGRDSDLSGQGENSFKDSRSTSLSLTHTHTRSQTHWRTVHCSQHISTLSLDCLNTTGGEHDLREQVGTRERETERGRKRRMIEGRRGREKRRPSMTSEEITHSPELLFSCYHFPRQCSCHIRPQVCVCVLTLLVCMRVWMSDSSVCGNTVYVKVKKAKDFWISMRWSEEVSSTMTCILNTAHCMRWPEKNVLLGQTSWWLSDIMHKTIINQTKMHENWFVCLFACCTSLFNCIDKAKSKITACCIYVHSRQNQFCCESALRWLLKKWCTEHNTNNSWLVSWLKVNFGKTKYRASGGSQQCWKHPNKTAGKHKVARRCHCCRKCSPL